MNIYTNVSELIENLQKKYCEDCSQKKQPYGCWNCRIDFAIELIQKEASAADVVEVKHGSWNGIYDGYADGYPVIEEWECNCCGYIEDSDEMPTYNYCPHCGARMDGAE